MSQFKSQYFRRIIFDLLVVAVVMMNFPRGHAQNANPVPNPEAAPAAQALLSWKSGGVGEGARQEMQKSAASYNVHVMFTGRRGNYLASIPFSIRQRGKEVYAGVAEGPLLFLQLAPGEYLVAAEIDGAVQEKKIKIAPHGEVVKLTFVSTKK